MAYRHIDKKAMSLYAAVMLIAYAVTILLPVGWATYFLALPGYMMCGMTAMARANNLTEPGTLNNVRRLGLAMVAGMALMFIFEPLWATFPRWSRVFLVWAVSLVWLTSPGLPPWWDLTTGGWDHYTLREKLMRLLKSIHGKKDDDNAPT